MKISYALWFIGIPSAMTLVGLLLTIAMVRRTRAALRLRRQWIPARGTVVNRWRYGTTETSEVTWGHEVTYDLGGRTITATTDGEDPIFRRRGRTISIRYNPEDPEQIVLGSLWNYTAMFLAITVTAIITAIPILIAVWIFL